MRQEKIEVDGKQYALFIFTENRNSSRASIGKKGVTLRIPQGLPREEQFREIFKLKQWAIHLLEEKKPQCKEKGWKKYSHGDVVKVGQDEYTLYFSSTPKQGSSARFQDNSFYFTLSSYLLEDKKNKHISVLLSRLIARKKKQFMEQKISYLNQTHFNFQYKKIFLKYNTSNWGSCSSDQNINISTRTLLAPEDVIDYVCIHELAHLREKDHSQSFWNLVKSAMPDYEEKKIWLKENGERCWI